jgi:hypothetical protein
MTMNRRGFLTAAGVTVASTAAAVAVAQVPTSQSGVSSGPLFDAEKLFAAIKDGYVPTDLEARFLAGEINRIRGVEALQVWSRLQCNMDALFAVHRYVESHVLRIAARHG